MFHHPKKISDVLAHNSKLKQITEHAHYLQDLQKIVHLEIEAKYAKQCLVCKFENREKL